MHVIIEAFTLLQTLI